MRKFILFTILGLSAFSLAKAQEYNLFDAKDVDANGWIWFDSQEKIDKYVGEGKLIELFDAMHGGADVTEASATLIGAGTDQLIGGAGHKVGGLNLSKASLNGASNGGLLEMKLPSCVSFSLSMSSEGGFRPGLYGTANEGDWTTLKTYPFTAMPGTKGLRTWEALEAFTNANNGFTLKSSSEVYAKIQNGANSALFIHGFKIMTSTPTSGINESTLDNKYQFDGQELTLEQNANIEVYSLTGVKLANLNASSYSFTAYSNGVYILKVDGKGSKIVVR